MSNFQLKIPKRNAFCFFEKEKFSPEMSCFSLIIENNKGEVERRDFCEACWKISVNKEILLASKGYWKSKMPSKKTLTVTCQPKDEMVVWLKELYKNLEENLTEIYLLVLCLARFRYLILRSEKLEAGKHYQLYETAELQIEKEIFQIEVVKCNPEEIKLVQDKWKNKLLKLNENQLFS